LRKPSSAIFRRVVIARRLLEERGYNPDDTLKPGKLYWKLKRRLEELLGPPSSEAQAQTLGTRDGRGIVFVAYNGNVYPSGFLPVSAGNIRVKRLIEIYRHSRLFKMLREGSLKGKCGRCEFKYICGGSRARAYALTGDPWAEDPSCPYKPGDYVRLLRILGINLEEYLGVKRAVGPRRIY